MIDALAFETLASVNFLSAVTFLSTVTLSAAAASVIGFSYT